MVSPETAEEREVDTLYRAALRGDWKPIGTALSSGKIIASTKITERGDTILHIAAIAKQTSLVHNLVKNFDKSDLELLNDEKNTAFCFAAVSGVVEIAKVMYEKNNNLPTIRSSLEKTPLEMAILLRKRKMVEYLYPITPRKDLKPEEMRDIFLATIHADMYDISLKMLKEEHTNTIMFTSTENMEVALRVLARKPLYHRSQGWIWERLVSIITAIPYVTYFRRIYSLQMRIKASELANVLGEQISKLRYSNIIKLVKASQIFHDAAKIGNVEFLTLLTHSYPDLIWEVNEEKHSIFHVAVINRQEKVFSLIYQTGANKDLITLLNDGEKNNILHLAGERAPPSRLNIVSGAALQMQRELLWFKAVEKIVLPSYLQMKNKDGQTPRELFALKHETLREDGEKWMKKTATSCMVVATLIATVVFAAAFTVPGGYKEEKGTPIFLNDGWFIVFVTSDAVAMFTSTASIMTFLSLFTAQYREDDFLFSLPAKLMVGLVTLFASIVCMVITFSATFFLVYKEEKHGTLPKVVVALGEWRVETENAVQKFTNQNQNLNAMISRSSPEVVEAEDIEPQQVPSLNIYINASILAQHPIAY
ncbi:ankyrin repeat-containing At5g02620-like [Olea europaea subsp. europaea]|uniref:Ankyrin repeat-containing At5g02620-like n=1 Tax=Olea europaea subsp. europaea TaxID=158383 RepID=A0A8S0QLU4_OLEEU|nr:ankyrin repeat-containing At5g02620-like [Olea europaea subsp. europaea]